MTNGDASNAASEVVRMPWRFIVELFLIAVFLTPSLLAWSKKSVGDAAKDAKEALDAANRPENRSISSAACASQISAILTVATLTLGICGVLLSASKTPNAELNLQVSFCTGYALSASILALWSSAQLSRVSAKSNPAFSAIISVPNFLAVLLLIVAVVRLVTAINASASADSGIATFPTAKVPPGIARPAP